MKNYRLTLVFNLSNGRLRANMILFLESDTLEAADETAEHIAEIHEADAYTLELPDAM